MKTFGGSSKRAVCTALTAGTCILLFTACGPGSGENGQEGALEESGVAAAVESSSSAPAIPRGTSPRISSEEQAQRPIQITEMGFDFGSPDAPVKVLEISDFGCGYCRKFHEETFPSLLNIYVEEGFVQWKFIPFVLGMFPNGLEAATAAECAGEQDRFFPMQNRLFAAQGQWKASDQPYSLFSTMAAEEGLDTDRFDSCIEGGWRDNQIRSNIRLGQQIGVRGTPLFLVDGMSIPGALPLEDFRTVLDQMLRQKGITPPPQ